MKENINQESRLERIFPGADELTPSKSEYFTWINHTNEGPTERQTLANLAFFEWLKQEFGMQLDIYAFDAGTIDGPKNYYGRLDSSKFKRQFPNGFEPIYEKAKELGIRLGVWAGPDGFGETEDDVKKRIELMVSLCKKYNFILFKFDRVCGPLRPEKQDDFIRMLVECRRYCPDLIVLNHRLDLGKAKPHTTTELLQGLETYVDVSLCNEFPATHHRAITLSRPLPPGLKRLQEDHGVCLSSCLDFWDDDLILQAFNRSLICSPQLYGNPWFLRDDEYSKLARIFNLHRRCRDFLVKGIPLLNKAKYGPRAVSRGDGETRFITLLNLEWVHESYTITLSEEIGLKNTTETLLVHQIHPTERVIGEFHYGDDVSITVPPFRSCLIIIATKNSAIWEREILIHGIDYEVIKDHPDKPLIVKLLGMPGTKTEVSIQTGSRKFKKVTIDNMEYPKLLSGKPVWIEFPGKKINKPWHRLLAELEPYPVPKDAETLYEAAVFAATNNCLEARSILRSGPSQIPAVREARKAFFDQSILKARGVWDRYAFDGDNSTRTYTMSYQEAALRIDLGETLEIDSIFIKGAGDGFDEDEVLIETSVNLYEWTAATGIVKDCLERSNSNGADPKYLAVPESTEVPFDPARCDKFFGESRFPLPLKKQRYVEVKIAKTPVQYIRIEPVPLYVLEIAAKKDGVWLQDRSKWRMNFLFEKLKYTPIDKAWYASFTLDEISKNNYLCVALFGEHGEEGAYASLKIGGKPVGASDRAPSYPGHAWEAPIRITTRNYTYYFPLKKDYRGKKIEVYVLGLKGNPGNIYPEAWITAHPPPFDSKKLVLY
ncbi:MAG: discoidin domain-containing protein [Promethearchaeota archaeon]